MADPADAERRLPSDRDLLDRAPCGIALTDQKGLLLKANSTLCAWLGYDCAQLVGVRRIQDLLSMGGRIFHQTHWAPLLQMQGSISEVKLDLLHAQGHSVPMVLNAVRREHNGEIFHELSLAIARDRNRYEQELIIARKQAESNEKDLIVARESLAQALESAEDRAKFAEQLVGIVSHDLRNPLGAIQLSAQVLARFPGSPQLLQTVERIDRSVKHATRLIGDLLDFTQARVGSGLSIHKDRFDLQDCVANAVADLRAAYPSTELAIQAGGSGECFGDAQRIAQVLGNLVSNAVAYGEHGKPVTVRASVEPGLYLVEVHNWGAPIPQEILPALFEPMTRGETGRAENKSVGLGLFIVHEIVEAHQGLIAVSSSAAEGTRFRLEFPRP